MPLLWGGDIQVFTESAQLLSAAVVTSEGSEDEEDGPELHVNKTPPPPPSDDSQNTTPPKRHEVRHGAVENKLNGPQTNFDARIQLQADLVVTCATQLETRVKSMKSAQEVHSIDSFVCYRLPFSQDVF